MAAGVLMFVLRALAQEPVCAIGGAVVDSANHKPVVHARVMAEVSGSYSLVKLTDEQGSFCFQRLTPADYHLTVQKAGYMETEHGAILAVEENTVLKPLALEVTRYGAISGMVVDARGEPAPGAEVRLFERVRDKSGWSPNALQSVTADSRGAFRISELAPGAYYLSAKLADPYENRFVFPFLESDGQIPREKEVETFYSASFTFADANPVQVGEGKLVENLVLTLKKAPVRRVTGRIENLPANGMLHFQAETQTGSYLGGAIPIAQDGRFAGLNLLPEKYTLWLRGDQGLIARKDVDLSNGDALGITLDPIETVDIPVTFRTEGKGPLFHPGNRGDLLLETDGSDGVVAGQVEEDGSYRFKGVPRAVYRVHIEAMGQKLYVKAMTYGGEAVAENRLDLRAGAPKALEVTLSAKLAELQGRAVVQAATGGEESDGVTVILVDQTNHSAELTIARQVETDQKGRFRMGTVAPGRYRLFAIEGFDVDRWGKDLANALAEKSVDLELKESEKKQVSVTVISSDEWAAAVKKSGG